MSRKRPASGQRRRSACSRTRSAKWRSLAAESAPAHHHPREEVEDHRQVELALARQELSDVAHPALVGPLRLEAPIHEVRRDRLVVIAHPAHSRDLLGHCADACDCSAGSVDRDVMALSIGTIPGYHRYYAHRTYECHRAPQMLK